MEALVDSNVILDILTEDRRWASWSAKAIEECNGLLVINPVIYAEVSIGFERIEDLDAALSRELFRRDREEVERNMHQAMVMHLDGLREDNLPIPGSEAFAEYMAV